MVYIVNQSKRGNMSIEQDLNLEEALKTKGVKTQGFVNIAIKADRTHVRIPVFVITGEEEGPTILVDACTHGDEYEGAEAIINVASNLKPSDIKGTFIGIPALNFDAFNAVSRISPIDFTNLNRIFPGNPNSFITQRVADTYIQSFVKNADFIISFHGGGDVLYLESLVGYQPPTDDLGKKTYEMAKAFGTEVIWRMQNLPFNGVSVIEARKLGIPAILPEIGSHCTRQYDRQKNIEVCANGILNVMSHLGITREQHKTQVTSHIDTELHYVHSDFGGIHTPLKKSMGMVEEGEVLANITDVFGEELGKVYAPFDGIVLGYWSIPIIQPGDWSYLFAKLL